MKLLEELRTKSENNLVKLLNSNLPEHSFSEVLTYACLPPGKLFRSMLVQTFARDTNTHSPAHDLWGSSIELHHTYTLIHDDLPSMDDDNMRRGRESTHIKFNEWKAVLAGDALLALSFGVLAELPPEKLPRLLEIYHQHTGVGGLILGQVLDLGGEDKSLEKLLRIHELKTARLIQLSLRGANILSNSPISDELALEIGHKVGINFQLLDDLCELTEELNDHERDINPFLHFESERLIEIVRKNTTELRKILEEQNLENLKSYLNTYMLKIQTILNSGMKSVQSHIQISKDDILNLKL